ncbi:hypothetical protein BpHYR1_020226 [Brachionus plicatilis]|uniref:Uncharacterized protein n=1 Tax=Brachionus plicatilis TaxID=10195 RepID=A0A3M7RIM4_BRAPC|nr:hypothetical protein BpHYR1_020226 [Brachionus plicatilis]
MAPNLLFFKSWHLIVFIKKTFIDMRNISKIIILFYQQILNCFIWEVNPILFYLLNTAVLIKTRDQTTASAAVRPGRPSRPVQPIFFDHKRVQKLDGLARSASKVGRVGTPKLPLAGRPDRWRYLAICSEFVNNLSFQKLQKI